MIASITGSILKVGFSMFTKVVTESFAEVVIKKVTISLMQKLAKSTKNTLDDELVKEAVKRLNDQQ